MSETNDRAERAAHLDFTVGTRRGYLAMAYGVGPTMTAGKLRHTEWREAIYRWPDDRDQVLVAVGGAVRSGRVDVYLCPLLRSTPRRRQGEALPGGVVWVDVDDDATDDAGQVLALLNAVTVASGRPGHLHGYVRLDRDVDPETVETLNRALARRVGGDAKHADNSVLRLAGTVSHKTAPATPVRFVVAP